MTIRWMNEDDLDQIAALENRIFQDPWSAHMLEGTLSQKGVIAFLAEQDGQTVGYFLGMQIVDEAEIYRIASSPEYRKKGIGRALMDQFLTYCNTNGIIAESLEVREGNTPARRLYESYGFQEEGRLKKYYHDPEEDGLILWKRSCRIAKP